MSTIRDPRSSEGYKPRFELWGNVFIHQALANVVNSLSSFEATTESVGGHMVTEVRIPMDRLIWNLKLFRAWIIDEWREKDSQIGDIKIDWAEALDPKEKDGQFYFEGTMPDEYLHSIIEVLTRRKLLKFRKQRSIGGPAKED